MQLYFIRHGQSINNANSDNENYQENPDPYLTEIGKKQARTLAEYLKSNQTISNPASRNLHNEYGFGFTHIYTSLMERAVETASYTAQALGNIPFTTWMDIHEEGGIYAREEGERFNGLPGKPRSFFEKNFPDLELPASLTEAGWWNRPFEDEAQRQPRADKVLAELLAKHGDREGQPEEHIVFVSHGGFFVRFLSAVLQLPWRQGAHGLSSWFMLHNCSISRFDFQKDYAMATYINNTSHLPAELITG